MWKSVGATNLFLIAPYICVEFMKTEMSTSMDAVQVSSHLSEKKYCQGKSRNVQLRQPSLAHSVPNVLIPAQSLPFFVFRSGPP